MTLSIESMIAEAQSLADGFAAVAEEDAALGGVMITSTPWAVALKNGPVRAAIVEAGTLRTVAVKAHLCGFTTMDRAAAERVAALLNEDGNHFEPVLVSSMAAACHDYYRNHAAAMREVLAVNR